MVRIITDSAADFEPHELESMQITCVPLSVMFGEKAYQENIDITKMQFYDMLETDPNFPHTSQPSPEDFASAYRPFQQAGDEAVVVTISTGLSGTYQSACMARDMLEYTGCYVIDSLNGTGGERMLVEHAVRLRDAGRTAAEIAAELEALRSRVVLYASMDTLEYLYRGGRISHTAYKIGSIAHIKPMLHVDPQGRAEIPVKTLGLRRGMDFMCKQMERKQPDTNYPIYVMYTKDRSNGEILAQRLAEMGYPVPEHRIVNVGAVVGTHIGPYACGIVYIH